MLRKLKPTTAQETLREKGIRLFSPEEFRRLFSVSVWATQWFIKQHQKDLFVKLRKGLYALRTDLPDELEIANKLYRPSYVSFEYALAHYGVIPEAVYSVTSATPRLTREFRVLGKSYEYCRIKKEAYTGYQTERRGDVTILIAKPEKALVDYLYFVDLKLRTLNERLNLRKLNKRAILDYARRFQRKTLLGLLERVL